MRKQNKIEKKTSYGRFKEGFHMNCIGKHKCTELLCADADYCRIRKFCLLLLLLLFTWKHILNLCASM